MMGTAYPRPLRLLNLFLSVLFFLSLFVYRLPCVGETPSGVSSDFRRNERQQRRRALGQDAFSASSSFAMRSSSDGCCAAWRKARCMSV